MWGLFQACKLASTFFKSNLFTPRKHTSMQRLGQQCSLSVTCKIAWVHCSMIALSEKCRPKKKVYIPYNLIYVEFWKTHRNL